MTDPELIQLVQDKSPDDLTLEEIEQLRSRLRESPELARLLYDQMQLEQYLGQAFGRVHVSVDDILATAKNRARKKSWTSSGMAWTACSLLVLAGVGTLVYFSRGLPGARPDGGHHFAGTGDAADSSADAKLASANTAANPADDPTKTGDPGASTADAPEAEGPSWPELDPEAAPVRKVAEMAYASLPPTSATPMSIKNWLAPVPGSGFRFFDNRNFPGVAGGCDGLFKLRAPWPADAVLRLAPFDHHGMAMYFWAKDEGASFHYFQYPRPHWVAYVTTRKGTDARPATFAFAASDNDRYDRSQPGAVEFRYQDRTLLLTRGEMRLCTVPFPDVPSEVFVDRRVWVRAIQMYRGEPFPEEPRTLGQPVYEGTPATFAWKVNLKGAADFQDVEQGGVAVAAPKGSGGTVHFDRGRPRVGELVFQLVGMTPGTGFYLGDASGKPLHRIAICKHQQHEHRHTLELFPATPKEFVVSHDVNAQLVRHVRDHIWVRLVTGCGTLKMWLSQDGTHWSRAVDPPRGLDVSYQTLGLFAEPGPEHRRIALKSLQFYEFSELAHLAPAELRANVPSGISHPQQTPQDWLARVGTLAPPGVRDEPWRAACALETLARSPRPDFGHRLLDSLVAERLASDFPHERMLQLLAEVSQLYDSWDATSAWPLYRHYEALGRRLVRESHPEPFTTLLPALLTHPWQTATHLPIVPEMLVRQEMLAQVYADEWDSVQALCDRLRFFSEACHPHVPWPDQRTRLKALVAWANSTSIRMSLPKTSRDRKKMLAGESFGKKVKKGAEKATQLIANERHPLLIELSKEGFNTLAEIQSALAEESFSDACQIITAAKPEVTQGLLPDARDPRLLITLPQAVAAALRENPVLQQTMSNQFGPLGLVRVQQAIVRGDVGAIRSATIQFLGSAAAAEAHIWLGERALEEGDFEGALADFNRGLSQATSVQIDRIRPLKRLASAFLGRDEGTASTGPIALRGSTFSADNFEAMVRDVRKQSIDNPRIETEQVRVAETVRGSVPAPGKFDTPASLPPWTGEMGRGGYSPDAELDWSGRQLAITRVGQLIYVGNRFQVAVFDIEKKDWLWKQNFQSRNTSSFRWPGQAMKPVVTTERVYVRHLGPDGPQLACLNRETGDVLWTQRLGDHVASDPLIIQGELRVITATTHSDGSLQTWWTTVKPDDGKILKQVSLVRLLDGWDRQVSCRVVQHDSRTLIAIGGSLVCSDVSGQVQWARRQVWIPIANDPYTLETAAGDPLVSGEFVYVLQPGVLSVECVEIATGRRVWYRAHPNPRRLLAADQGTVVLETKDDLLGLTSESGEVRWSRPVANLLDGAAQSPGSPLLVAVREELPTKRAMTYVPTLMWLDLASGAELARTALDVTNIKQLSMSPLIPDGDGIFAFLADSKEPNRKLIHVTRTDEPLGPPRAENKDGWETWVSNLQAKPFATAAATVLPRWRLFSSDRDTGLVSDFSGVKEVISGRFDPQVPCSLYASLVVPEGKKVSLEFEVGSKPTSAWEIRCEVDRKPVDTFSTSKLAVEGREPWTTWKLDLAPYAGRQIELRLVGTVKESYALVHFKSPKWVVE